jgi:hypothetical protein
MQLKGKVIFIISYENWGSMLMSKHHYAIELAKAGNNVFFINHPDKRKELKRGEVRIQSTGIANLSTVKHRLFHPYFLKFTFNRLYNFLTSFHIRKIIKATGCYPDVVWSFDCSNAIPLRFFPKSDVRIFMPVDGPFGHDDEKRSAENADIIISVTDRILSAYNSLNKPKLQINHGVADVFLNGSLPETKDQRIRVGYSGSLVRNDLDTDCFLKIIKDHPDKTFEFWGEYDYKRSNIHLPQDVSQATLQFLEQLKQQPNVIMHGPVNSEVLARGIKRMDVLLICYKIRNDHNNHHKVLEYLGTGKVIVSSFMSPYKDDGLGLIQMARHPQNNNELPAIFNKVVNDLKYYNSEEHQTNRKKYARQFSYSSNIRRIEKFINSAIHADAEAPATIHIV